MINKKIHNLKACSKTFLAASMIGLDLEAASEWVSHAIASIPSNDSNWLDDEDEDADMGVEEEEEEEVEGTGVESCVIIEEGVEIEEEEEVAGSSVVGSAGEGRGEGERDGDSKGASFAAFFSVSPSCWIIFAWAYFKIKYMLYVINI